MSDGLHGWGHHFHPQISGPLSGRIGRGKPFAPTSWAVVGVVMTPDAGEILNGFLMGSETKREVWNMSFERMKCCVAEVANQPGSDETSLIMHVLGPWPGRLEYILPRMGGAKK
ncbi:hypothetical protein [Frankia sp. CcI49]|uniref:hypothetical protein n=1 Tax=Frankia sp. CcI49 TaxID=1745382 RepID=UPI0010543F92|nr:hypothetical protein [Frankia sp. CcI49]